MCDLGMVFHSVIVYVDACMFFIVFRREKEEGNKRQREEGKKWGREKGGMKQVSSLGASQA